MHRVFIHRAHTQGKTLSLYSSIFPCYYIQRMQCLQVATQQSCHIRYRSVGSLSTIVCERMYQHHVKVQCYYIYGAWLSRGWVRARVLEAGRKGQIVFYTLPYVHIWGPAAEPENFIEQFFKQDNSRIV